MEKARLTFPSKTSDWSFKHESLLLSTPSASLPDRDGETPLPTDLKKSDDFANYQSARSTSSILTLNPRRRWKNVTCDESSFLQTLIEEIDKNDPSKSSRKICQGNAYYPPPDPHQNEKSGLTTPSNKISLIEFIKYFSLHLPHINSLSHTEMENKPCDRPIWMNWIELITMTQKGVASGIREESTRRFWMGAGLYRLAFDLEDFKHNKSPSWKGFGHLLSISLSLSRPHQNEKSHLTTSLKEANSSNSSFKSESRLIAFLSSSLPPFALSSQDRKGDG